MQVVRCCGPLPIPFASRRPIYTQKSAGYMQKSPVYTQKSPGYMRKSPIYTQKSPGYMRKSFMYTVKSPVLWPSIPSMRPSMSTICFASSAHRALLCIHRTLLHVPRALLCIHRTLWRMHGAFVRVWMDCDTGGAVFLAFYKHQSLGEKHIHRTLLRVYRTLLRGPRALVCL